MQFQPPASLPVPRRCHRRSSDLCMVRYRQILIVKLPGSFDHLCNRAPTVAPIGMYLKVALDAKRPWRIFCKTALAWTQVRKPARIGGLLVSRGGRAIQPSLSFSMNGPTPLSAISMSQDRAFFDVGPPYTCRSEPQIWLSRFLQESIGSSSLAFGTVSIRTSLGPYRPAVSWRPHFRCSGGRETRR
jgi:hypothetical protein